jgi:hypothetical protein
MSQNRRNTITYNDSIGIAVIAVIAAIGAAFADASPTGATVTDAVVLGAFAALITWLGASAPWWALMTGAAIAVIGAISGPFVWIIVATVAFTGSAWIGWDRANFPIVRAVIAALVVQVSLRLDWNEFFMFSGLLAAAAMGVIGVTGFQRRRKFIRRRIMWSAVGLTAFSAVAVAGVAVAAAQARTSARDGYLGLLDGLEFVQRGDVADASTTLQQAATDLADAEESLGGPLTQLARVVPILSQNRNLGADVLADASVAAASAANTLQFVDLDQLTVVNGVVDINALAVLEPPLTDLAETVGDLHDTLVANDSNWLIPPIQSRLDTGIRRADQAAHQATATAAAARIGPDILGADGERRYLLAFVNNAEARGTSGLMGNWSELTITDGRLEVTENGRTNDLESRDLYDFTLEASDEYFERYRAYGAGHNGGTARKYWSNVTIPADMPSVGSVMAQMYEAVTGRALDGVFVIDPAGVAGLLDITGPVDLPAIDQRINARNAQQFLTLDQYEFAENEREDLLTDVTDATVDNVLTTTLPPPQQMAASLAPAVLNGHISGWAARPAEQELLRLIGMDASLPRITTPGTDAIAAVNINRNANKIDSFLVRTIDYRPTVNEESGNASATLTVSLQNTAPTSGFEDYVIGNRVDLPVGSNRTVLDISTRLNVITAQIDGEEVAPYTLTELGYNVHTSVLEIPPGDTVEVVLELEGNLGAGDYELVFRPQPLPTPDTLVVDARTSGGDQIFEHDGVVERRSVLSADGVRAWR